MPFGSSETFDDWRPPSFRVSQEDIASAAGKLEPVALKSAQFTLNEVRNFAKL